jgi:anaerobic dimethyl sulfoxide reductase subunit B (iron-sulfur subunit)
MSQIAFHINADKCLNCKACAMACKEKHDHIPGRKFRRIHSISAGSWTEEAVGNAVVYKPNNVFSYSFSIGCNHCADPACMKICPANAIGKRADGIVFIDRDACIGCQSCASACPYNAPSFNKETEKMEKCDFCRELLAADEQPACVAACSMQAIEYADLNTLRSKYPEAVQQVDPLSDPAQTKPSLLITPSRQYNKAANISSFSMPEELQAYEA